MKAKTNSIARAVDDVVVSLGIKRNSICLVMSDVAKCMVAADAILTVNLCILSACDIMCSPFIEQMCFESQISL